MNEAYAAQKAAIDALKANAGIVSLAGARVYKDLAPQEASLPYVLVSHQLSSHTQAVGNGPKRIASQPQLNIKAVTDGNSGILAARLGHFIDQALVGVSDVVVSFESETYDVQGCWQDAPIDERQIEIDKNYFYNGGLYRFFVSPR